MDRNTSGGHRPDTENRPVTDEADLPTEKATTSTSSGKGFSTFLSVLIALGFLLLVLFGVVLLVIQAEFG